jgi:hypothetical protein
MPGLQPENTARMAGIDLEDTGNIPQAPLSADAAESLD